MKEQLILSIIEQFNSSAISELELEYGGTRLSLRKERTETNAALPAPVAETLATSKTASAAKSAAGESGGKPSPFHGSAEYTGPAEEKITSPIVGTFYPSPSPDAPPFVKPGAKVKAGETLCILESMKMMNHMEAEFNCEIIEILAGSGELVEFGQNLFTVKRL
jgi:acetyl-CoA carboxylase biotin carboxyl carrier protein